MIDLRLGRWQDVLADVDEVDCLITDPPYSARTHRGHDHAVRGSRLAMSGRAYKRIDRRDQSVYSVGMNRRRAIDYQPLDDISVVEVVEHWSPRVRGWICVLTDHILAPVWSAALEAVGRYVFSPLACMDPGSRVRLSGDGPSQWSVWLIVARPRTREAARWGALRGGYVRTGPGERRVVIGGKPMWLMKMIVGDYSKVGDLVCDPYAGGATTLLAASQLDRRAVGAEMAPETYQIARERIARHEAQLSLPMEES